MVLDFTIDENQNETNYKKSNLAKKKKRDKERTNNFSLNRALVIGKERG